MLCDRGVYTVKVADKITGEAITPRSFTLTALRGAYGVTGPDAIADPIVVPPPHRALVLSCARGAYAVKIADKITADAGGKTPVVIMPTGLQRTLARGFPRVAITTASKTPHVVSPMSAKRAFKRTVPGVRIKKAHPKLEDILAQVKEQQTVVEGLTVMLNILYPDAMYSTADYRKIALALTTTPEGKRAPVGK